MNKVHAAVAAVVLLALAPAHTAGAVQISIDPAAAGLTGNAFTADALTGGEVSRINNVRRTPLAALPGTRSATSI